MATLTGIVGKNINDVPLGTINLPFFLYENTLRYWHIKTTLTTHCLRYQKPAN